MSDYELISIILVILGLFTSILLRYIDRTNEKK